MAQIRPEVRPATSSMPVDGFVMQTGGSARRRVVPFDTAMSSYKVTGVPGHTHNTSAVCSALVDNTEKSQVPLIINDHFAFEQVSQAAPRFTDSPVFDESNYDRAIERAIGEIAIVPENCHQEIREPARAISELRTLVMPKDRRDTLTYVEEVGGFVSQATGEVPSQEPAYPDVVVDLFHDYNDAVQSNAIVAYHAQNNVAGTGNSAEFSGELRFTADSSTGGWDREVNVGLADFAQGPGTSFVPLKVAGEPLAVLANGEEWHGLITMQWDPDAKLYFCPAFEVIFRRMYETSWNANGQPVTKQHDHFEVQFPRITTRVSRDGQCLFTEDEWFRPLVDNVPENGGSQIVKCTVDQSSLEVAITNSEIQFKVWPFRIATGYQNCIRGPGLGTSNFWTRVRRRPA